MYYLEGKLTLYIHPFNRSFICLFVNSFIQSPFQGLGGRLLAVPFWIVERARAQHGETGARRKNIVWSSFWLFCSAISHTLSNIQKETAGSLAWRGCPVHLNPKSVRQILSLNKGSCLTFFNLYNVLVTKS